MPKTVSWTDILTSFATLGAAVFTLGTLIFFYLQLRAQGKAIMAQQDLSKQALDLASKQFELTREQLYAQTFAYLLSYERDIDLSRGCETVRKLDGNRSRLNRAERKQVLSVVNFVNNLAHLIRHRYIPAHVVWLLYTPAIEACQTHLLNSQWWVNKFRDEAGNPKYYLHFETLCEPKNMDLIYMGRLGEVDWPNREITPSPVLE